MQLYAYLFSECIVNAITNTINTNTTTINRNMARKEHINNNKRNKKCDEMFKLIIDTIVWVISWNFLFTQIYIN